MKKRILAAILSMALAAACFTACGDSSSTADSTKTSSKTASSSSESKADSESSEEESSAAASSAAETTSQTETTRETTTSAAESSTPEAASEKSKIKELADAVEEYIVQNGESNIDINKFGNVFVDTLGITSKRTDSSRQTATGDYYYYTWDADIMVNGRKITKVETVLGSRYDSQNVLKYIRIYVEKQLDDETEEKMAIKQYLEKSGFGAEVPNEYKYFTFKNSTRTFLIEPADKDSNSSAFVLNYL